MSTFNHYNFLDTHNECEQNMLDDLISESIHLHGETFKYICRTIGDVDSINIFNEDRIPTFENAFDVVGYLETNAMFDGSNFLLAKFGTELELSMTLTISKKDWKYVVNENGIDRDRPREGDWLYWPNSDQLFVIKFVDDKNPMMTFGKFYTYRLEIELVRYNNEVLQTNEEEIDIFQSLKSFDQDGSQSLYGGVIEFQIIDNGKGYQTPPTIVVDSLTGSGLICNAKIEKGRLIDIEVVDHGNGYHSTDEAIVIGKCDSKAIIKPIIKTVIENSGNQYAQNEPLKQHSQQNAFDVNNPFGIGVDY